MKISNLTRLEYPLRSDLHLLRKLWHVGVGSLAIASYYFFNMDPKPLGFAIMGITAFAFTVEFARFNNKKLNAIVCRMMGPFIRKSEINSFSGFPFYALGCGLSMLLFQEKIAVLSIFFLVYADPFASLFGVLYGRDKLLPNKSLQGVAAAFCICYLIALFYLDRFYGLSMDVVLFSLFAGVAGALSELASVLGIDDNLTIPVVSGIGLTIINLFIPIF
jgi:diacylglycerol kinase (CTP)